MENSQINLTPQQILPLCQRAFGEESQIETLQEIGGGTFNSVYLVKLKGYPPVILRLAPPTTAETSWEDLALMRREHHIQPFFAPIAALMPKTIMVDFTHQLIDRDYMFQSLIEGQRWDHVEDELSPAENLALWGQLGKVVKKMHSTKGEKFGWPEPGPQFSRWRELVIDHLQRSVADMQKAQLDTADINIILDIVRARASLLDEIKGPCLLHGDLWLFNTLIVQEKEGPRISGIIDGDRAWWGDPMADWLMFLLATRQDEPEWAEVRGQHFWEAYGWPDNSDGARFREEVYKAMHIGSIRLWSFRNQKMDDFDRAGRELHEIAQWLSTLAR